MKAAGSRKDNVKSVDYSSSEARSFEMVATFYLCGRTLVSAFE